MLYAEIISGLWIGDVDMMYNKKFIQDNQISIIINCTTNFKFSDIIGRLPIFAKTESGFKTLIHLMPNLPGSNPDLDIKCFNDIMFKPEYSPPN